MNKPQNNIQRDSRYSIVPTGASFTVLFCGKRIGEHRNRRGAVRKARLHSALLASLVLE